MSRYTIHAIADADCTSYHDEVLAQTHDAAQIKTLVSEHSNHYYGACIVDNETGLADYGWGFGIVVGGRVKGADTLEDYDTGTITAIDEDGVTVAWDSAKQTTTQPCMALRGIA